MMVIYGSRLFGKTDQVPGMFHVATKFGHINYIPLIPLESYIVLGQDENNFRGAKISLHWKSVLLAWFRAACYVAAIILPIVAVIALTEHRMLDAAMEIGFALGVGALLLASYFVRGFGRASYVAAVRYAEILELNPIGHTMIEAHFGNITPEEAKEMIVSYEKKMEAEKASAQAAVQSSASS